MEHQSGTGDCLLTPSPDPHSTSWSLILVVFSTWIGADVCGVRPPEHRCGHHGPTCFVRGDGELVAGVAVADDVFGDHADVVGGRRVEVNDGGLVELGRHVFGDLG